MKSILVLSTCMLLSLLTKAQIPTTGLLAYYPFNGNASDLSGNNVHGTVNGALLTVDRFGTTNAAYIFNGTSNYINLPTLPFMGLNIYSYSFWIKPTSFSTGMPVCFGESSVGYCQAVTFSTNGTLTAAGYNIGFTPQQSAIYSGPNPLNQWHHVVMTRNLTSIKLYVNGVQVTPIATANTNGQNADYGSNLPLRAYIGARTTNTSYFHGAIDDLRIYNVVLNDSNVTALYRENCQVTPVSNIYTVCTGNSATLAASSTFSIPGYVWFNSAISNSAISSGSSFVTPLFQSPGTYSYYVNELNCVGPRFTININVNPTPSISVNSGSICSGKLFTIAPSGAYTYSIQGGYNIVNPAISTNYSVVGTSSMGCLSSNTAICSVTVHSTPTILVNSGSVCIGNGFTINPSGAATYTIQGGNHIVYPLQSSTYSVAGTSSEGCTGIPATCFISVHQLPLVSAVADKSLFCLGESSLLYAYGATTYSWSTGATASAILVSPSITTTYSVIGTDNIGCSKSATVTLYISVCENINETTALSSLEAYPNPNNGLFSVDFSDEFEKVLDILDMTGRSLFSIKTNDSKAEINILELANGFYYLRVQTGKKLEFLKIVKQY